MTNPGSLTVSFGAVSLEVTYGSEQIGTIEFPNFSIAPGQNTLPTTFYFSPTDPAVGTDVLSALIAGRSVPVQIVGTSNSTAIPALQNAMSLVSLSATLPALQETLFTSVTLGFTLKEGVVINVPFTNRTSSLTTLI
jgi:hypothetical protein